VDARLVFAANRDLRALAERSEFLPDLGYRIGGLTVRVPPLRERREDFDLLAAIALRELRREDGFASLTLAPASRDLLSSYDWPGNVRELFSVIRAAAFLLRHGETLGIREIDLASQTTRLSEHARKVRAPSALVERVAEFEREEILLALRVEGGNQTRAAERLGLSRRGLNKKLHRYGLLDRLKDEGLRDFRCRLTTVPIPLDV
jgi:transcriptional regulator with GAF, ATPase, and Fis domain